MSQIDISQWKKFKVIKLFNVELTDGDNQPKKMIEGDIPLISATADNNGIIGYYTSDTRIFPRNTITVDMFGHAFVQSKKYQTVSHGRVNVFLPKKTNLSFNSLLFIASVINKVTKQHDYGYKTMLTRSKSSKLIIKLPVDSNGDPDWQYMDTYIAKLTALARKNVSSLKQAKAKPAKLNIDHWGEFKISDIYEHIEHPIARSKKHYESGNIPFIASGAINNGIDCYLAPKNKQDIDKGNCLTISPVDGSCFYQPNDFLGRGGGGSAISILRTNKSLSQATHVFLASIISHTLKEQYSFGNMGNTQKIKDTIIKLPIDANGEPDWEYMDNQVRHFARFSKNRLRQILKLLI